MTVPASGNAGGDMSSLPKRRLSRGRWRRIDYEREWAEHENLRACERALTAVNEYSRYLESSQTRKSSKPSHTAAKTSTAAKPIARFMPDGKGHKPDPCKGAKGVWGRARRGVL